MIISHKHRFIFLKTRKTASTSIEIALSSICGEDDVITPISEEDEKVRRELGYRGPQNYKGFFKDFVPKDWAEYLLKSKWQFFSNHATANEVKGKVSKEVWDGYFKFCFERNPFDRVISNLYYWHENGDVSLSEYIENGGLDNIKGFELYSISKVVAVDRVYPYEDIPGAMEDISERLGLEGGLRLPEYKAKSNYRKDKRPYQEDFGPEEREKVKVAFAREIQLMGYEF